MITPDQALAQWFTYLLAFQSACPDTNAQDLTLLAFANSKITDLLPTANEQGQFLVAIQSSGFEVSNTTLLAAASFEALLDRYNPLPSYVGLYLQTFATAPYPSGAFADFLNAATANAFPGGASGPLWQKALGKLMSIIPSVCLSATLQSSVAKTLNQSKKMSDVVNQIAVLG